MRDGDTNNPAVRRCLPVGGGTNGGDFSFSIVFGQVSRLSSKQPIALSYDFFKVFLRSADRSSEIAANCLIPIRLSTGGSMLSGAWQIAIEACGLLYHEGAGMWGLVFFSRKHSGTTVTATASSGISTGPTARAKTSTIECP